MAGDGALAGIFTYMGWAFLPNVNISHLLPCNILVISVLILAFDSWQHLSSSASSTAW